MNKRNFCQGAKHVCSKCGKVEHHTNNGAPCLPPGWRNHKTRSMLFYEVRCPDCITIRRAP